MPLAVHELYVLSPTVVGSVTACPYAAVSVCVAHVMLTVVCGACPGVTG